MKLRRARLNALLGFEIPAGELEAGLRALGVKVEADGGDWTLRPPSWRYDLRIEPDFIEEAARLHGYDRIPLRAGRAALTPATLPESKRPVHAARAHLAARGWFEAVTYSFVDPRVQDALMPDAPAIRVDNPMTDTLSVMRTTLWSGLVPAWLHNRQRQQPRVRLFELGARYALDGERVVETTCLAGIAAGSAVAEQWGSPARPVDFYDLKADLESLLPRAQLEWGPARQAALHPGRSAELRVNGQPAGWLGALHPRVVQALDLPEAPWVFELRWDAIEAVGVPAARPVTEFPSSRRDLALVVPEEVTAEALVAAAREAAGGRLARILPFDVFRGGALPKGCKSVALGLIFQDYSRTLTDTEVDEMLKAVRVRLEERVGASIRS